MLFKIAVVALLLLIVISLFSALAFLYKDSKGERTARALTVRVSLSLLLFLILMAGFYFGLIPAHSQ